MVITDPKVIEYIESFEALKASNSLSDTELSGKDQVILYTLTEMFKADEAFRLCISLLFHDFSKKRITLKRTRRSLNRNNNLRSTFKQKGLKNVI